MKAYLYNNQILSQDKLIQAANKIVEDYDRWDADTLDEIRTAEEAVRFLGPQTVTVININLN